MWLQVGLASGAVVVLVTVLRRIWRRRTTSAIDVGSVSESWLAEQRGRRNDSL
jgi:hypothetical protein